MDGSEVVEVWHLFRGYTDKKSVEALAEKYIDLVADLGTSDEELKEALGEDKYLDEAITYYLDLDEPDDDNEPEWED